MTESYTFVIEKLAAHVTKSAKINRVYEQYSFSNVLPYNFNFAINAKRNPHVLKFIENVTN